MTIPIVLPDLLIKERATVPVHSNIAEAIGLGADLFYLVRGLDISGSGYADVLLSDAAKVLQRSNPSIRRRIYRLKELGMITYQRWGDRFRIWYINKARAAARLSLSSAGATFACPLNELHALKEQTAYHTTLDMQRRSEWLAKKSAKASEQHLVVDPAKVFEKSSEKLPGASVQHIGPNTVFCRENAVLVGASQQGVANRLGRRSRQTISNRLSDKRRARKGLPPIKRKQLAQARNAIEYQRQVFQFEETGRTVSPRLFIRRGRCYMSGCAIYSADHAHQGTSSRRLDQSIKIRRNVTAGVPIRSE